MDGAPTATKRGITGRPWLFACMLFVGALLGGLVSQGVRVLRGGDADWAVVVGLALGSLIVGVPLAMWLRWADRPPSP